MPGRTFTGWRSPSLLLRGMRLPVPGGGGVVVGGIFQPAASSTHCCVGEE